MSVSARTKLEGMLYDYLGPGQLGVDLADEILTEHAHELAERIRAERDRQYGPLEFKAEKIAINRMLKAIDPEAEAS